MVKEKLVPIRICSPHKARIKRGYLWEIYKTPMLQYYFAATGRQGAILSRKYGICMPDEKYQTYSDEEQLSDRELLGLIRRQRPGFKNMRFIYWNHRPMTHDKWVAMLRMAGYTVDECSTLLELRERLLAEEQETS